MKSYAIGVGFVVILLTMPAMGHHLIFVPPEPPTEGIVGTQSFEPCPDPCIRNLDDMERVWDESERYFQTMPDCASREEAEQERKESMRKRHGRPFTPDEIAQAGPTHPEWLKQHPDFKPCMDKELKEFRKENYDEHWSQKYNPKPKAPEAQPNGQ